MRSFAIMDQLSFSSTGSTGSDFGCTAAAAMKVIKQAFAQAFS